MLLYLNKNTWASDSEALAADIREAQRIGVHLQTCHEAPSVLDLQSFRGGQDFKTIMDETPPALKSGPGNIYKQIAVAMKGGDLREVGLINLALKLTQHAPRVPLAVLACRSSSITGAPKSEISHTKTASSC